jgi:hypothetical protein
MPFTPRVGFSIVTCRSSTSRKPQNTAVTEDNEPKDHISCHCLHHVTAAVMTVDKRRLKRAKKELAMLCKSQLAAEWVRLKRRLP